MSTFRELKDDVLDDARLAYGVDDEKAGRYLNEQYQRVCTTTRLTRRIVPVTLTPGQGDYDLAADLGLADVSDITNIAYTSASPTGTRNLVSVEQDQIVALRNLQNGWPIQGVFSVYGSTLMLWPAAQTGDTATIAYVYRPVPMQLDEDEPSELPDEFHDILVDGALARAARRSNPAAARAFRADYLAGVAELRRFVSTRDRPSTPIISIGYPARATLTRRYHDQDCF